MVVIVVCAAIFLFAAFGLWGHWLERHPERTPAGRDAAVRQRHQDEMVQQAHAHELAMARAHYEAQMAVYRSSAMTRSAPHVVSLVAPVLWPSSAGAEVVDLDVVEPATSRGVVGGADWWGQSAGRFDCR